MAHSAAPTNWKVQLFKLNYDEAEVRAATEVVRSGWLTMGEQVQRFEQAFAELLGGGAIRTIAVTNCTAALHMALLALDIGDADEVIIPSLTFVADANVVRMVGARPVLADCTSLDDLNMDPKDIERKITSKTKAVIVVHYAGYACDMDAIVEICKRNNVALIEDVAHAPGATFRGRALGSFGDVGCFSFFSNKNLSIGEGGLVCTGSEVIAQKLMYLRSHGMTTLTLDRHRGRAFTYDVIEAGMNFRMDEVHAALGMVQLSKLGRGNKSRQLHTERYRALLEGGRVGVPFGKMAADQIPAYHILPVMLPENADRLAVMQKMREDGIQTSIHYPPFWDFHAYRHFQPGDTPITARIAQRQLTLPLYPEMSDGDISLVVESLNRAIG